MTPPYTPTQIMLTLAFIADAGVLIKKSECDAERELKEVASSYNKDLSALAKLALASHYGNTNRTKDALDLYKQLIDKPTATVSKVMAQLQLAALYESSQQPAEAKRMYEQIAKENPKSEAEQIAQTKLQNLK